MGSLVQAQERELKNEALRHNLGASLFLLAFELLLQNLLQISFISQKRNREKKLER
jgi:hypothetical protein